MSRGKILFVDDDELIAAMLGRGLKTEGYEVRIEGQGQDVVPRIRSWAPDIVLLDIKLPDRSGIEVLEEIKGRGIQVPVVMLTADDTAETAIRAMKLGAVDYLTKPFNLDEVKIVIGKILENERLQQEVDYLRKISSEFLRREIIGDSPALRELQGQVKKIVQARVPTVLITGESGTGKELFARHIHHLLHGGETSRYTPFIGINCSALPETILESELFGHEKGSFTDAKFDKKGVFELAHRGSILLDEIGEMKLNLQSKLLRVLEERTVRRIGGKEEIQIDATVLATTNCNLSEMVDRGEFRMDLFFRLNAFSLHLPPLRERKEDIPVLSAHYLSSFGSRYNKKNLKGISPEAEKLLVGYHWPGNVRELRNVIERIVVLENAERILPEHLPKEIINQSSSPQQRGMFILPDGGLSLDELEKDLIQQALEKAKQNKTLAAKLLSITYDTLRYQIKKFGLDSSGR
ncbi:MAG: sigma-54-dependent Fis family transcriptional regulator [Deltaproteobacteria bacterium]|nr:sigma-54-dependent Fis family transcriptional regulator [Deltaproteobacteria bacterium]